MTVSDGAPYEETMDIPCDEKGLSLTAHIFYDEALDILSFSLAPNRPAIFFRADTRYKDVYKSGKVFVPQKLSYRALSYSGAKYKLSPQVFKLYSPNRKMHLYNKWIGDISPNLELLPAESSEDSSSSLLVTNDSLLLRFKLKPGAEKVSFKLRNVLVIETLKKNPKNGKEKVRITGEKDLNTTFNITIHRDPCFGTAALADSLFIETEKIKLAYSRLRESCPDGMVRSEEEEGLFRQHRMLLLAQFPPFGSTSECSSVQELSAKYNSYIDSIRTAPCKLDLKINEVEQFFADQNKVSTELIVSSARRLNDMALRLMTATDPLEKSDIADSGEDIIADIHKQATEKGVSGDDKAEAIKLFNEAVEYFRLVVIKTR